MSQVYVTIDLVILGWLVSGASLGDYAAATKLLAILASVTGLVVNAALPAFASRASQRDELAALMARVWHWLMVTACPAFMCTAIFAPLAVRIGVGSAYDGASPLLRILCLAGVLGVLSNFVGTLMIATNTIRTLFIQNFIAIVLNVSANVLLVPHFGVAAAAWITVATEALVCAGAVAVLARRISFRRCLDVSVKPSIALVLAAAVGVAAADIPLAGVALTVLVYVFAISILRAWPPEFEGAVAIRRLTRG
jgi:O-antigen/teichoic acid export membrane protein